VENVAVALIGTIGVVIAAMIANLHRDSRLTRQENSEDHARVKSSVDRLTDGIDRVERKVERIDIKLDEHTTNHNKHDNRL